MEVRSKGSRGDQGRKGAVLMRTEGDRDTGGEAVEMLQQLYKIQRGRSWLFAGASLL